jgi:hypothetical protein
LDSAKSLVVTLPSSVALHARPMKASITKILATLTDGSGLEPVQQVTLGMTPLGGYAGIVLNK